MARTSSYGTDSMYGVVCVEGLRAFYSRSSLGDEIAYLPLNITDQIESLYVSVGCVYRADLICSGERRTADCRTEDYPIGRVSPSEVR